MDRVQQRLPGLGNADVAYTARDYYVRQRDDKVIFLDQPGAKSIGSSRFIHQKENCRGIPDARNVKILV